MANENYSKPSRSVNTSGPTYKNSSVEVPCALGVKYWNDMIQVEFVPELPKSQQTQTRRYDYDHSVLATMRRSKCKMLSMAYHKDIVPALEQNIQKSRSVSIAGVNQLMIDTNIVDGEAHPVIRFIQNIDESTLKADPSNVCVYEFNRAEILEDYNFETGEFKGILKPHFELDLFMDDLDNALAGTSNAYVHATKYTDAYFRESIINKLNKIGEANGLSMTSPQYGNNGGGGKGSIFTSAAGNSSQESVPAQNVSSLEELDAALGN